MDTIVILFHGQKLESKDKLIRLLGLESKFKREFPGESIPDELKGVFARALMTTMDIKYKKGWGFRVGSSRGIPFIQVEVSAEVGVCSITGESTSWRGGKRYLSENMTDQELVGVFFDAIKSAEDHETREMFRYKGSSIYNPHLKPSALVGVASKGSNFDCRPNKDSMEMK